MTNILTNIIETEYPIGFRKKDAQALGSYIRNRHSVEMVGMKRVGISNFLRFFIYHPGIVDTYIQKGQTHIFIPIDLNDLVEREIYPFWVLTLKRIVDTVEISITLDKSVKKAVETIFLDAIQSKDLFLAIDAVRICINKILEAGLLPTIFFIRFDRMQNHATKEFLDNLVGLKDSSHGKLNFVFTTYRRLDHLAPQTFNLSSLSLSLQRMYLKPAEKKDMEIIVKTYLKNSKLQLTSTVKNAMYELTDGYVQYTQLLLIILHENHKSIKNKEDFLNLLLLDERIILQSEELWESLNEIEKEILVKVSSKELLTSEDREKGKYLWETGLIKEGKNPQIFSTLFEHFINQTAKKTKPEVPTIEFSKKENKLFNFLKDNLNQICERESIISAVWPEEEALGVSDWAIDRLVARVRSKLKQQNSRHEIITVKTRGYKLITT